MRGKNIKFMLILLVGLSLVFVISAFGQPAKRKILKHTAVPKQISGEVVFLRQDSMALLYGRDDEKGAEYEILFRFDPKKVKFEHLGSLADLAKGDVVMVQYDEDVVKFEGQPEEQVLKVKVITLVSKATPKPVPVIRRTESGVLISE